MKKVAENTFRAYARQAVKKLNTTELTASLKSINAKMVEISLYLGEREVGYVSVGSDGFIFVQDYVRDDLFSIAPENNSLKKVFENVYTEVNGSLDNGWFTVEKEEVAEETVEEPKAEDSKVKAVAQYLESKITGWYENARVAYCVKGKFISCKAEGENGIRINWEEDGKEYTMVISWFAEYSAEQLYNIWMAQDVEVEEVKKQPKEEQQQKTKKIEDAKGFLQRASRAFDDAGFGFSCKRITDEEYSIHAIKEKDDVTIKVDFFTGHGNQVADFVVRSSTGCTIISYANYSTEKEFVEAAVKSALSISENEKKVKQGRKMLADAVDGKVSKIRAGLAKLEELEAKTLEAEKALEADVENTELDKAWDEAYNREYEQYCEVARLIADLIDIDICTAKSMIMNYRDQLKNTGALKTLLT